jgi:AcrR family transcriptional regulator
VSTADDKADRILDSSLEVFCRYGFQKTSMLDIAQAAGMSRAALYLHFANKEDVFRSGSMRAHDAVMAAVEAELSAPRAAVERIRSALMIYFDGLIEQIGRSEHGAELFDVNAELIGDVARAARARLIELLAAALRQADDAQELSLAHLDASSSELATLLLATLDGLTHPKGRELTAHTGIALQLRMLQLSSAR